jgi:arsenite methyltransferase
MHMTNDVSTTLPPALRRALDLLVDPPAEPDVSNGYLDLLGTTADDDVAKNTGAIQAAWASTIGSLFYDNAQALTRRFIAAWQLPIDWLAVPQGGVALDVGAGPGSITTSLARAAGPDGLALGVDISEPMLARAVRAAAGPQVGFLRADAQRLPFRDETIDVAVSIAVLQLIPDPAAALSEIARVLKPGGRLAVMVPTLRPPVDLWRALPTGGARIFSEDEVGDILESHGFSSVRVKSVGTFQWVRGKRS